ncbi:MAG: YcaO-like family protein, partial [Hyphomicrobiales bacterium]|nr:YcaO-like family protein [Hyphomicrobiales bacterium]
RPNSHSLSVSLGKGPDVDSAMISAAMEAAETAIAERLPDTVVWTSIDTLNRSGKPVIDLSSIARCHPHRFAATETTAWKKARNLGTDEITFVPWSLIGLDHRESPAGYHDAFYVASDGLASGNTHDEAVFHALCELIERDALAKMQFLTKENLRKSEFQPTGQEDVHLPALLQLIESAGLRLRMFHMQSDTELPAFLALLEPKHYRHEASGETSSKCGGCGCHPNAGRAIVKAITEAAQARLALVAGARDDIRAEHYEAGKLHELPDSQKKSYARLGRTQPSTWSLAEPTSIQQKVEDLTDRLNAVGIEQILVVELEAQAFGIHVVRVIADELQVPLQGNRVQITQRGLRNMQGVAA